MASFLSKLLRRGEPAAAALDYGQMIKLDAEDLAEQGIKDAYERLLPQLRKHVRAPAEVEEVIDDKLGAYLVRSGGRELVVYSPAVPDSQRQSWGRAAYVLFTLVNEQLAAAPVRFFALNGGNDLGGMFLTPGQAKAAHTSLRDKSSWPYIPTLEHPYYGQAN